MWMFEKRHSEETRIRQMLYLSLCSIWTAARLSTADTDKLPEENWGCWRQKSDLNVTLKNKHIIEQLWISWRLEINNLNLSLIFIPPPCPLMSVLKGQFNIISCICVTLMLKRRDVESDGLTVCVFIYFMYLWLFIYTDNFKYEVLFPLEKEWVVNCFLIVFVVLFVFWPPWKNIKIYIYIFNMINKLNN